MARQPRPGAFDYDRMAARFEEAQASLRGRLEELFDGLSERMSRIERDAAAGEMERAQLLREIGEVRRDLGEGRDMVNGLKSQVVDASGKQVAEAAKGAAEGAATVAARVVTTGMPIGSKQWRWGISALAGIAAFGALADNLPKIVRLLSAVWHAIDGVGK